MYIIKEWFNDNLYAYCDVFKKFRYVHEWAGCNVSLETSWSKEQWEKLSPLSAKREFGKLRVNDSFLYDYENAIKKHIKDIIIPKLPRPSHDIEMAFTIEATIIRKDDSIKTEKDKACVSINSTVDNKIAKE